MEKTKRPLSSYATIVSVTIAAILAAFQIYTWWDAKQNERIVNLQGLLVSQDNKPTSAIKIMLRQNMKKSSEKITNTGLFSILNVRLPDNNKMALLVQRKDTVIEEIIIDISNPIIIDNNLSLGTIKVNDKSVSIESPPTNPVEEGFFAYVNTKKDPLVLRNSPSITGRKIGHIAKNEYVRVVEFFGKIKIISGRSGRWCKIEHGNREGYVFSGFLNPSLPQPNQ